MTRCRLSVQMNDEKEEPTMTTKPTTRKVRYLDKLIDELAKGKAMEKILRK